MKITLLFLLFSTMVSAQNYIELRLVSADVGGAQEQIINSHSTDSGLDAILQNYGTTSYVIKWEHPIPSFNGRIMNVEFSGNASQLLTALNAYNSVVDRALIGHPGYFSDALYNELNKPQIGIPVGIENNVIVTNDEGLNAIFETYNVYFYERAFPGAVNESLARTYHLVCDCDNALLKTALENYNISVSNYMPAYYNLDKVQFNASQTSIYPNPFTTHFTIDSNQKFTRYAMSDLSGKQLVNTDSKMTLDNQAEQLHSGIYLLELQTTNGQTIYLKLIKR